MPSTAAPTAAPMISCAIVPTTISDKAVEMRSQIESRLAINARPSHSAANPHTPVMAWAPAALSARRWTGAIRSHHAGTLANRPNAGLKSGQKLPGKPTADWDSGHCDSGHCAFQDTGFQGTLLLAVARQECISLPGGFGGPHPHLVALILAGKSMKTRTNWFPQEASAMSQPYASPGIKPSFRCRIATPALSQA